MPKVKDFEEAGLTLSTDSQEDLWASLDNFNAVMSIPGMLFHRLMQQAVFTSPLPYHQIIERKHNIMESTYVKWTPPPVPEKS